MTKRWRFCWVYEKDPLTFESKSVVVQADLGSNPYHESLEWHFYIYFELLMIEVILGIMMMQVENHDTSMANILSIRSMPLNCKAMFSLNLKFSWSTVSPPTFPKKVEIFIPVKEFRYMFLWKMFLADSFVDEIIAEFVFTGCRYQKPVQQYNSMINHAQDTSHKRTFFLSLFFLMPLFEGYRD